MGFKPRKRTAIEWRVDICYPLDKYEWSVPDIRMREIAGKDDIGSGTGPDGRDLEFCFPKDGESRARAVAIQIKREFPHAKVWVDKYLEVYDGAEWHSNEHLLCEEVTKALGFQTRHQLSAEKIEEIRKEIATHG